MRSHTLDLDRIAESIEQLHSRPDLTEAEGGLLECSLKLIERLQQDDQLLEDKIDDLMQLEDVLDNVRHVARRCQESNVVVVERKARHQVVPETVLTEKRAVA